MNGRFFMEAMGDIKDEFIMEAADIDEIKRSFSECDDEEEEVITETEKTNHKKIKRIPRIRRLLIAALISVSLLLAANFVAMAMGYDTIAILKDLDNMIVEMFEGEKTEYKGLTILKCGEESYFKNVKEFFEKTDYDILYPSKLPDGIEADRVILYNSFDKDKNMSTEYKKVIYTTSEPGKCTVDCDTNLNANHDFLTDENAHIETIGNFKCYIYYFDDVTELQGYSTQSHFIYNGNVYTVTAPTYDDMVTIISNMKEYEE